MIVLLAVACLASDGGAVGRAERVLEQARATQGERPLEALALAHEALKISERFVPTDFGPTSGRKGEVVEDDFQTARQAYRAHRGRIYEGVGRVLAGLGRWLPAARYLRRAVELDSARERTALAEALLAAGRGEEALDWLLADAGIRRPSAASLRTAALVADALGLPSLQAELDRRRLAAAPTSPPLELVEGPLAPAARTKLSTGVPWRLDDTEGMTLLYVADRACASCSADLEAVRRLAPPSVRVVLVPPAGDDRVLRQTLALYRYDWPVVTGHDPAQLGGAPPPYALVVGRRGWSAGRARTPLVMTLPALLKVFEQRDVDEQPPRAAWRAGVLRRPVPPRPTYRGGRLVPGEDEPAPPEFVAAETAYATGRLDEAERLLEVVAARADGWLLPAEARANRALLLAARGRVAQAREALRVIGDSRFQEALDRALEGEAAVLARPRGVE